MEVDSNLFAFISTYLILFTSDWMEVDSNHRSNLQQIYSLSPLATRESIHVLSKHFCALTR